MSVEYWDHKDGHWQSVPEPARETAGTWYRRYINLFSEVVWHHVRHDGCDNPGRQITITPKEKLPADLLLTLSLLEIEA